MCGHLRLSMTFWSRLRLRPSCLSPPPALSVARALHGTACCRQQADSKRRSERSSAQVPARSRFFDSDEKSKKTFMRAVNMFREASVNRRGYVDFILASLDQMEQFNVHRDIDVYKALLGLFPIGDLVATNTIQIELRHRARQQDCAIEVLTRMEKHSVIPDVATNRLIVDIFGAYTHPHRRLAYMNYWMPKFRYSSPWQLPERLPDEQLQLAQLAVARLAAADPRAQTSTYLECDLPHEAQDRTWLVSCQSEEQRRLLAAHPASQPLLLEGAFRLWLRDRSVNYFVLRAEPAAVDTEPAPLLEQDDISLLENWTWQHRLLSDSVLDSVGRSVGASQHTATPSSTATDTEADSGSGGSSDALAPPSSSSSALTSPLLGRTFSNYGRGWFLRDTRPGCTHRQHDGTILGVCITGTSSRDSLLSWLRLMQRQCPRLSELAVLLPMKSPLGDVVPLHHHNHQQHQQQDPSRLEEGGSTARSANTLDQQHGQSDNG